MKKRLFWILFKYGLGIGLLAWVIWRYWSYPAPGEPGKTLGLVTVLDKDVSVLPLALAAVICLCSVLLTFVRWYVLVRAQELPFTLPNALRLGLIGFYLSTFLPGSVGGDIFKATFIAREQSRRTVAVATVLIDRAVGLVGLVWLVGLTGGIFWATGFLAEMVVNAEAARTLEFIVATALGLVGGSIGFWFVLGFLPQWRADRFARRLSRIPKVGHSLAEFWRAVWMYRCQGRSIALALTMAMVGHVGFVLTFYCASLTLNAAAEIPSLAVHFLIVPVGMAIEAGFPAPGGVGGGEVGFGALYKRVGSSFDSGVLMSLVRRVIMWTLAFCGYLVYLRMRPALRAKAQEAIKEDRLAADEVLARDSCGNHQSAGNPVASSKPVADP